jgi:hypothetical protein
MTAHTIKIDELNESIKIKKLMIKEQENIKKEHDLIINKLRKDIVFEEERIKRFENEIKLEDNF